MQWTKTHPSIDLGFLPGFLSEDDPRPAVEQIDAAYQHGGGWQPFHGFRVVDGCCLQYPSDPVLKPLAWTQLRDERVMVYRHHWVMVMQPDRSYEIARVD
jgi:hypothetical protein